MYSGILNTVIDPSENILWQGRPNKRCYIMEGIFNSFLPFALLWALFDGVFIYFMLHTGSNQWTVNGSTVTDVDENMKMTIGFFAIHLMPVWIYIFGVIATFFKYKNVYYIVTDKKVYIAGGTFVQNYEIKEYEDMNYLKIHRGFFDNMLGVGDVILSREQHIGRKGHTYYKYTEISDIYDYMQVYRLIVDTKEATGRTGKNEDNTYAY